MNTDKLKYPQRLCALLTAVLLFLGGCFGARAVGESDAWHLEDWQESAAFENMLHRYIDSVMILEDNTARLEKQDELSYMEKEQLENTVASQRAELAADRTWFRYQIRSADGTVVNPGNLGGADMKQTVQTVHYAPFPKGGRVPGEGVDFETYDQLEQLPPNDTIVSVTEKDLNEGDGEDAAVETKEEAGETLIVECGVAEEPDIYQIEDEFSRIYLDYLQSRDFFTRDLYLGVGLLAGAALFLLLTLILTGKRAAGADYMPTWLDRTWLEVHLAVSIIMMSLCIAGLVLLCDLLYYNSYYNSYKYNLASTEAQLLTLIPLGSGCLMLGSGLFGGAALGTLIARITSHTFAARSLLCRLFAVIRRVLSEASSSVPAVWRVVVSFGLLAGFNLLAFTSLSWSGFYMAAWWLVNLAVLLYLCHWAVSFRKIQEGCCTIAAGNLNHQIDTSRMPEVLRDHGENLNNISQGLSGAVDEKIKSERFKAELITNVSHDLKTPLTSIINYVDLLKSTEQTDPRALEYIEVLDRKSMRLKKLTEDLVEASKASTGVLTVNREKIGMAQLLSQALAEWEEKLSDRNLSVVTTLPEGETWVNADGRHLWRVIDNLLSNCCKYAMEGTRIYLDLTRSKGQVALAVKNISREPLNVPPEQLMERFVRGEESRSTEGSGLGLSIARSLTELQGGTFELFVDGDLFKAVVSLAQAG